MKTNLPVYIEKMYADAVLPEYATKHDAGMDIRSYENTVLRPGETKLIHTGLKVAIPENYEIQIRPRSGLSAKSPFRIANSPGTIDSGYRGEICIIGYNTGNADNEPVIINKGDRIAQLVLSFVPRMDWVLSEDVSKIGENRGGGFGSTGNC